MTRAYVITGVISSVIVSTWFRSGTFIATGDMGPFIRRGWSAEVLYSWNHQVSGAGSAAHTIGRIFEFFLIDFVGLFGADETVAQWLFYTIFYGMVAVGTAYAAAAIVRSPTAVVVAGSFAVMNGFFLTRIPNPLNIISVGTVAIFTGMALRVAQGRRIPPAVGGIAFLPTSFLAFNPPMFVVAVLWAVIGTPALVFVVVGRKGLWKLIKWFAFAAPWVILLNLWWMLPFIQAYTGGGGAAANSAFTDPTNWTWAQINNQIPNILTLVANWAWFRPQYLPFAASLDEPTWIWMRYMIPVMVFLAPVLAVRARRRAALWLIGISGFVVFLAKGLMPPLEQINLWMYLHVPMFWLFREPMSKLGQLLVVFFAILIAIGVEGVAHRFAVSRAVARAAAEEAARAAELSDDGDGAAPEGGAVPPRRRRLRWPEWAPRPATVLAVATGAGVLAILAYPRPIYTGGVIPDIRPMQPSAHVRVPEFWRDMAETIDSDPRPGKVLILPLDDYYQMPTTWGFFGVDSIANLLIKHPVVTPKPDGYFGDAAGFKADVDAIQAGLLTGDFEPIPALLDGTGISQIVVRHDLVRGLPGRKFADDRILAKAMKRVPGVTQTVSGPLDLWKVGDGSSELVRAYDRTLLAAGRTDAGAAVVGSVGTGTGITTEPAPPPPTILATVDNEVAVTDDTVFWPVPAVDAGTARTSIRVPKGTYRVAQRARAAAVVVPSYDKREGRITFRDPTRVTLDGRTISQRPPWSIRVPRRDIIAVQTNNRIVSLDGWGRERYPRPKGEPVYPPTVTVGSATPFVAYAPSREPADPTPFSDVYDCNNYEPRPTEELELRKQMLPGNVVRLSAIDHAACTRVVIQDARPGRAYRVRLEYRQVKGKRPQICLWQVGTDGCELAPRPRLGNQWNTYEKFVIVDQVASEVQLVLHADVGERLLGRTVTDYRNVTIEAIDPVAERTLWPAEVPYERVRVPAGKHELAVVGGMSGSAIAEFEPLQDCFRYDDQTQKEAGLAAVVEGDPDNPTFTLKAREHMACLGATVPDMGASSLYEFSLEGKSISVRDPKFCLYLRGPDACEKLPTAGPWEGWTHFQALVGPNEAAVETRVYLYGLRDLTGQQQSEVAYRDVKLRPVASPNNVVLVREPRGGDTALSAPRSTAVFSAAKDPIRTSFVKPAGPSVIGFIEGYAPGWQLAGAEHIMLEGWMNGWLVAEGDVKGVLTYRPAVTAGMGLVILPMAIYGAILSIWLSRRRTRRLRAKGRLP